MSSGERKEKRRTRDGGRNPTEGGESPTRKYKIRRESLKQAKLVDRRSGKLFLS